MSRRGWSIVIAASCLLTTVFCQQQNLNEASLIKTLLQDYTPESRPVLDSTNAVRVTIDLALSQLIDLDAKRQELKTNIWLRHYWKDEYLTWNASEYNGLAAIRIPSNQIWRPDIVLYNRRFEEGYADTPDTNAVIYSDGSVNWNYPTTIQSSCVVDITYFPYDKQECLLTFGSWTYDGFAIDLYNRTGVGDLNNLIESEEWQMIEMQAVRNVIIYGCCPEPYPDVTYHIRIKRKSLFYNFYMVAPCIVLVLLAVLGFCLPMDSGEKLSLGITMLLSLVVFAQIVSDKLPASSRAIPLIGQFFGISIVVVTLSSAATVIAMNLHFHGPMPQLIPSWLRPLLYMRRCRSNKTASTTENPDLKTVYENVNPALDLGPVKPPKISSTPEPNDNQLQPLSKDSSNSGRIFLLLDRKLDSMIAHLKTIVARHYRKDTRDARSDEWKQLAIVVDRILLGTFMFIALVATAVLLGPYAGT
ncbi:PREDICTED: neuronal acetylcholine receptor subunit alpha-10-like [Branchiostoma belcheri]|uniref:Neuronal acetylcholine receptor subunit alpha-10-like n=1 Tax=Branchiostoma belcheri TaxID=7741 RepID=A0A6P4YES5_BRABE|nr:PREDICTED: neuronal acetylcholine receptor subunit alpha-10-like [Branchiostoma belcheri]